MAIVRLNISLEEEKEIKERKGKLKI